MVNTPNFEKLREEINESITEFKSLDSFYKKNKKTNDPLYTRNLRKVYNELNKQIETLRNYNNSIETENRIEKNKKKGIEDKPKKIPGRKPGKKSQKGGTIEEIELKKEDNLTPKHNEIFLKAEPNKTSNGVVEDTLKDVFDETEIIEPHQIGGTKFVIKNKKKN